MKPVSIKRDIYLYLFGLVIGLSVVYSLMIKQSYQVGLDESAKYGFLYEYKLAEQTYLATGNLPIAQSETLRVFDNFADVPAKFVNHFDWDNFANARIYEGYIEASSTQSAEYLYAALFYVEASASYLYVVSQYDENLYLQLFSQAPPESYSQFNMAFALIGILLICLFLLIRVLIYRLTQPLIKLAQWAKSLDLDNTQSIEKLRYKEAQSLADHLIDSVQQQRDAIARESFFLNAASHELRTPVATISASNEMLERLSSGFSSSGQRAVKRIARSVTTMQNLIFTLLWMSKKQPFQLDVTEIDLTSLAIEIVQSHSYLADGKDIAINLDTQSAKMTQPLADTLVEIAVTNLIRNALQHSDNGVINIVLTTDKISIDNPLHTTENSKDNNSFGIGQLLITRLCQSQNWTFDYQLGETSCHSSLYFGPNE